MSYIVTLDGAMFVMCVFCHLLHRDRHTYCNTHFCRS